MKIQLIGQPVKSCGKTLWEIVGNLKNFGVGRLVKRSLDDHYPEPCYFKIMRVQPIPPPTEEFSDRRVIVWIEEVFRGRKLEIQEIFKTSDMPDFQLIPKHEEESLTGVKVDPKAYTKVICKYIDWPPLYKKIWEEQSKKSKTAASLPKLATVPPNESRYAIKIDDKTMEPSKSSLIKTEAPVEELLHEVVRLKKLINMHKLSEDK